MKTVLLQGFKIRKRWGSPIAYEETESSSKKRLSAIFDPVVQTSPGQANTLMSLTQFKGIKAESLENPFVPDTNGTAGETQYMQIVNDAFAIFDKATGKLQYGPVPTNTLWAGFGKPCGAAGFDPVVLYDKGAKRWVITNIVDDDEKNAYQCIAVSTSSDARGSYYRYAFYTDLDGDYTKMGIWSDGYYIGMLNGPNRENLSQDQNSANICALDRTKMLNGQPATMQCANIITSTDDDHSISNPLPSDFDGITPPKGTPNYFSAIDFKNNAIRFYPFYVNWTDSKKSHVTGPITISVASFKIVQCEIDDDTSRLCIPQPGTQQTLDSLTNHFMNRLAYRYFTDGTGTLVVNHTVTSNTGTAAIRWYQFKVDQNQQISIQQQGTFSPNSTSRWLGSIAVDKVGNIALGYNVSSSSDYPGIGITGRNANDPAGQLQDEKIVVSGNASQTKTSYFGDYSAMTIDPVDDCTFWYTSEYIIDPKNPNTEFNWSTYIASFKFPNCK